MFDVLRCVAGVPCDLNMACDALDRCMQPSSSYCPAMHHSVLKKMIEHKLAATINALSELDLDVQWLAVPTVMPATLIVTPANVLAITTLAYVSKMSMPSLVTLQSAAIEKIAMHIITMLRKCAGFVCLYNLFYFVDWLSVDYVS